MKNWNSLQVILCLLGLTFLDAQSKYPADSLLMDPDLSIVKKSIFLPIAGWQRISYNTAFLNCQFSPSCSNFGAQTIREKGIIPGVILTSDRIMRCNPAAYHYHIKSDLEFDDNGYLLDPVHPIHIDPVNGNKSPLTAAVLSAMIPGLGRIYNGRIYEGFLSGLFTSLMGYRALESYQYDSSVRSTVLTLTAVILYTGEIYGAYRTTKYYPSRIHP